MAASWQEAHRRGFRRSELGQGATLSWADELCRGVSEDLGASPELRGKEGLRGEPVKGAAGRKATHTGAWPGEAPGWTEEESRGETPSHRLSPLEAAGWEARCPENPQNRATDRQNEKQQRKDQGAASRK